VLEIATAAEHARAGILRAAQEPGHQATTIRKTILTCRNSVELRGFEPLAPSMRSMAIPSDGIGLCPINAGQDGVASVYVWSRPTASWVVVTWLVTGTIRPSPKFPADWVDARVGTQHPNDPCNDQPGRVSNL
jgi:hypothetical protein